MALSSKLAVATSEVSAQSGFVFSTVIRRHVHHLTLLLNLIRLIVIIESLLLLLLIVILLLMMMVMIVISIVVLLLSLRLLLELTALKRIRFLMNLLLLL